MKLLIFKNRCEFQFFFTSQKKKIEPVTVSLTLSGAVERIRPTCIFAVLQAFLINFTLFSAQVFDFRLLRNRKKSTVHKVLVL